MLVHDGAKLVLGNVVVADERDAADGDRLVLGDRELDDHLVVALRLDRALDVGEEVALLGVGILDLLDAAADRRDAEDRVGLDLDRFLELVVLDLAVALELDGLDVRALADEEAQDDAVVLARHVDFDVVEEARVPERADVAREVLDLEEVTGLLAEVRDDVFLRDATVAPDLEPHDRRALGALGLALRDVDRRSRGLGRRRGGSAFLLVLGGRAGILGARSSAVGARGARAGVAGGIRSRRGVRLVARGSGVAGRGVAGPLGKRLGRAEQAQRRDGHEHRHDEQQPARKPSGLLKEKVHRQEEKLRGPSVLDYGLIGQPTDFWHT